MAEKNEFTEENDTGVFVFEDLHACSEELAKELEKYRKYEVVVLGLDCEWVSRQNRREVEEESPVCPVALLQLAFPHGRCFLIRLCQMNARLPDKLRDILEKRNILKTGVGIIEEDSKRLSSCYGLVMQGCVDLRHVASRCRGYVQHCVGEGEIRHGMSLSALSQQILGVTLDKDWDIRCGNWEAPSLSERQIEYAANDAIVAVKILFKLVASKLREKEERFKAGNTEADDNNSSGQAVLEDNSCGSKTVVKEPEANSETLKTEIKMGVQCTESSSADEIEKRVFIFDEDSTSINSENSDSREIEKRVLESSEQPIPVEDSTECTSISSLGSIFGTPGEPVNPKSKLYSQDPSKEVLSEPEVKIFETPETEIKMGIQCTEDSLEMTSINSENIGVGFKEIEKRVFKSSEKSILEEDGTESTNINSEGSSFSLGSTGTQAEPKNRKSKVYSQYPSFENLEVTEELLFSSERWSCLSSLCQGVVDVPFKGKSQSNKKSKQESSTRSKNKVSPNYIRKSLNGEGNKCVVCGRDDHYMRKNVIPRDYMKHFPECMKDHHSHDVLLLCPACHMISTRHDDMLRKKLAEKYNSPLASSQVPRLVEDPELKKVKYAAKVLLTAGEKIPANRREVLYSTVKVFFDEENLTDEMLLRAAEMETRQENCDFISHGREVVRKVKEGGDLLNFEKMWREHFLETMKPKYLPSSWTVDHEHEKLKRLLEEELKSEENSTYQDH